MSEQNNESIVEENVNDTNLDEFEAQFHDLTPDNADDDQKSDGDDDNDDAGTQPAEDADPDDDAVATEGDDDGGEEEGNEPEAKPKSRFQERIDQLNEKARKEKERADALEARLAKLEQNSAAPAKEQVDAKDKEPTPDDLNEDGTEKYPLGDYDPNYVKDLTRYTLRKEKEAQQAEAAKSEEAKQQAAAEAQLEASWSEKLTPARERYPDFQEKGEELLDVFADLDQQYGKYLSSTLMGMEYGPDVLYYLANHLDVAKEVVALGPLGATLALGKIEAQFEEQPKVKRKVTTAKAPPPANKGSAVAKPSVALDTDNLDDFSREFNSVQV